MFPKTFPGGPDVHHDSARGGPGEDAHHHEPRGGGLHVQQQPLLPDFHHATRPDAPAGVTLSSRHCTERHFHCTERHFHCTERHCFAGALPAGKCSVKRCTSGRVGARGVMKVSRWWARWGAWRDESVTPAGALGRVA
eukprot:3480959-Pyramimonas_sp.AAC.1